MLFYTFISCTYILLLFSITCFINIIIVIIIIKNNEIYVFLSIYKWMMFQIYTYI